MRYIDKIINEVNSIDWIKPIINNIIDRGDYVMENKPLFFELRFAYELYKNGFSAFYEYQTGVNNSSVDFKIQTSINWLIELVSIRASDASKRAVRKVGEIYEQTISTNNKDKAQSEEGEIITAEQKIGEKIFKNDKPIKFPIPKDNTYHMILSDCRGFLDDGGSYTDYDEIAYGSLKENAYRHYFNNAPIKGLFEESNPLRAVQYIQERIHFLGFITEKEYQIGEILNNVSYRYNPYLFISEDYTRNKP